MCPQNYRDIDRAREITKDKETNVSAYISPGSVKEVFEGFGGITDSIKKMGDALAELSELGNGKLTTSQRENLEREVATKLTQDLFKDMGPEFTDTIAGSYVSAYANLIAQGKSHDEAVASINSTIDGFATWFEQASRDGVQIVHDDAGNPYVKMPGMIIKTAVVADDIAFALAVSGLVLLYDSYKDDLADTAAVFAEGVKNTAAKLKDNSNGFLVKYIPGYAEMTGQGLTIKELDGTAYEQVIKLHTQKAADGTTVTIAEDGGVFYRAEFDPTSETWWYTGTYDHNPIILGQPIPDPEDLNSSPPPYTAEERKAWSTETLPVDLDTGPMITPEQERDIRDSILVNPVQDINAPTILLTEGSKPIGFKPNEVLTGTNTVKVGQTYTDGSQTWTRVGRWMSEAELQKMQDTGKVVEGNGGLTFISTSGVDSYKAQAKPGSVYVEFDVPTSELMIGGKVDDWYKIVGASAQTSQKYAARKNGAELNPSVKNIKIEAKK